MRSARRAAPHNGLPRTPGTTAGSATTSTRAPGRHARGASRSGSTRPIDVGAPEGGPEQGLALRSSARGKGGNGAVGRRFLIPAARHHGPQMLCRGVITRSRPTLPSERGGHVRCRPARAAPAASRSSPVPIRAVHAPAMTPACSASRSPRPPRECSQLGHGVVDRRWGRLRVPAVPPYRIGGRLGMRSGSGFRRLRGILPSIEQAFDQRQVIPGRPGVSTWK